MKLSIILFLIINFSEISCDECTCEISSDENICSSCSKCKYFKVDKTCIECQLDTLTSYYSKSEDSCQNINEVSGYKLIYGTKELVNEHCSTGSDYVYELGDICYSTEPPNAQPNSDNPSIYTCAKSFYIEEKNGFKYYTCYSTDNCPTTFKYFDSNTKECFKSCDKTIKKVPNEDTYIFRCSESCDTQGENKEYEYEDSNGKTYCLDKCPEEAKYYYTDSSDETNYKCLDKCNNNHFSDKNNKCVDNCNAKKIILDINKKTFLCDDDCPANFPYSYTLTIGDPNVVYNFCLKSCSDTNNNKFFGDNSFFGGILEETYLYEHEVDSNIIRTCQSNNPPEGTYFKDEALLKWVTDCTIAPSGPFHDSTSCRNSCKEGYDCSASDTFQCINLDSDENYYLDDGEEDDKTCYKICPDYLGRGYYDKENKKCTSCSDGFYRSGDKTCYNNCGVIEGGGQYYINDGGKLCFQNGCNNNPLYKYSKNDDSPLPNPITCYQSCFNISEARFEKDNYCYESTPDGIGDEYYYYKIKIQKEADTEIEFTKYTKNSKDCLKAGFPYLKGNTKECISKCEDYKILPTENDLGICCIGSDSQTDLSICLDTNYKYYNAASKNVTKKCNLFSIVDIDGELLTDEENCKEDCDDNYCEDNKNKLCYKDCNNYYINDGKKIYAEKCNTYFYKIDETKNKCVEQCGEVDENNMITKFTYYLETTKECIDTCPKEGTTENSFSYETENNHQPCLSECKPGEFYYDSDSTTTPKICLDKCDKYYKNNQIDNNLCVENCEDGELIYPGNICSTNTNCPNTAPFFIVLKYNDGEITNKQCVENCKEKGYNFYNVDYTESGLDLSPNQCMEECHGYIYNGGCFASCPEGLYIISDSNKRNKIKEKIEKQNLRS